ncbi:alpha/beta-hydrolase [Peniophora sp. CONT]|nr:alpha/beta-hydrolase [Peniophora sp. CONT]
MSTTVVKELTSKDGTVIYADAIGDPSKPHVVFVHGLSLSGAVFNDMFADARYNSEFYLVRYDMRGHGRSGKPEAEESYSSERYAEDYLAVAHAFDLKRPVFVGWSMGATVVVDIAQYLPHDTLSGVVYLTGLPYVGDIMGKVGSTEVLRMVNILCTNDDVTSFTKTKADFVESLFTQPDSVPYDLKMFWLGISMAQNPTVAGRVLRRPQDPTALYAWAKEGLPLLILSGSEDKQVLGQRLGEEMERYFTNLTIRVFDGLGHALFYEDPENVYSTIFDFARKVLKAL